ncbi:MAG: hypothetical protein IKH03_01570 [Oscillospiraceae bacterium]|nr:hypothetical protein [Oscillospiraceae bacterium]
MNEKIGELVVVVIFLGFLFSQLSRSLSRSGRRGMLIVVGAVILFVGGGFLLNAGKIINFEAVRSAEDVGTVAGVLGLIALVAVVGVIIVVLATRSFARQKHYEWRVDRFHDAWNSRKNRWL